MNHAREKELSKLDIMTVQNTKDQIEPIINAPIYEMNPDFWEEIRGPYMQQMHDLADHCHQLLYGIFRN